MPFLRTIENQFGTIGIWHIAESSDELSAMIDLGAGEAMEYRNIGHERRKREFLITRLLIRMLMKTPVALGYKADGRPCLSDSGYRISIAHSSAYAVIFLSAHHVGIDVEGTGRPIGQIARKFMSEREFEDISGFSDAELGMVINWCAKEAVFKCTEKSGIDFKTQIRVHPYRALDGFEFGAELFADGETEKFRLQFLEIGNNVLVWCVFEQE